MGAEWERNDANARMSKLDKKSEELPSYMRVVFGADTETTSYLWRKISNTHIGLGTYISPPGPGEAMPQGTPGGLTNSTVENQKAANIIRDWIRNGAEP